MGGSWVGSAGEGWSEAAEGEHGEGDEGVGGFESEGHALQESDLRVGGLDEAVGEAVLEGRVDRGPVAADLLAEFDEGRDAAACGPADPLVEGLFALVAFDGEDVAEAFFQEVGAVEAGVGLRAPRRVCRSGVR